MHENECKCHYWYDSSILAYQGNLWKHFHPIYECLFPEGPVMKPTPKNEFHFTMISFDEKFQCSIMQLQVNEIIWFSIEIRSTRLYVKMNSLQLSWKTNQTSKKIRNIRTRTSTSFQKRTKHTHYILRL